MTQETIDILLSYSIIENDGIKYLQIPLEYILNESIGIIKRENPALKVMPISAESFWTPESESLSTVKDTTEVFIPAEIQTLYKDTIVLTEDVVKYLEITAQCWEFHNVEFKKTILKKIAGHKPALNTAVFKVYGKDGDEILTKVITKNIKFIQNCWENGNKD